MSIPSGLRGLTLHAGIAVYSLIDGGVRRVAATRVARTGLAVLASGSGAAFAQEEGGSFLGDLETEVGTGMTLGVNAMNVGIFLVAAAVIIGSLIGLNQNRISIAGVFAVVILTLILAFVVSNLLESGSTAAGELGGGG